MTRFPLSTLCFFQIYPHKVITCFASQVGSYAVLSSQGALVEAKTSPQTQRELAALIQVPVVAGTVNR